MADPCITYLGIYDLADVTEGSTTDRRIDRMIELAKEYDEQFSEKDIDVVVMVTAIFTEEDNE